MQGDMNFIFSFELESANSEIDGRTEINVVINLMRALQQFWTSGAVYSHVNFSQNGINKSSC